MDTREKIVSIEGITGKDWVAVAGLFDPLTLKQAERVAAIASRNSDRRLLVVVVPGKDTLLPADARAALIAGLRDVIAVVIAEPDAVRARGIQVEEDAKGEARRSEEFVEFVLERQRSK